MMSWSPRTAYDAAGARHFQSHHNQRQPTAGIHRRYHSSITAITPNVMRVTFFRTL